MKCLSFGWFIVIIIILAIASSYLNNLVPSGITAIITNLAHLALIAYYIAGFFVECDEQ